MSNIVKLTKDNFDSEVLNSRDIYLVDFWANWCVPCKHTEPIIDELAQELKDKIKIGKVNVENDGEIANRFSVRGIPTFLIFKNGEVINQLTSGTIKKETFLEILRNHLNT
jgi:thioredoxin 1